MRAARARRRRGVGRALARGLWALVGAAVGASCAVDAGKFVPLSCPPADRDGFQAVSSVVERRCGTLDCHGSVYRPLKIYGQYGLRRPEEPGSPNVTDYSEYYTGGKEPTTVAELADNAASICGLEPEKMAEVRAGAAGVETLTLIRKAINTEKHKGGKIWNPGNPGYRCLVSWLLYDPAADGGDGVDFTACVEELSKP